MLLAEKEENLKSFSTKLERTQKTLRLLNNSTSKLDHLITTGKSFGDHNGARYKSDSSGTKTVFINFGLPNDSINEAIVKFVVPESKFFVK